MVGARGDVLPFVVQRMKESLLHRDVHELLKHCSQLRYLLFQIYIARILQYSAYVVVVLVLGPAASAAD